MLDRFNHRVVRAALMAGCLLVFAASTFAQLIKVEAGASDLLPSQGGTISFQGPNYTGYLGAGEVNGAFGLGAYVKTTVQSHILTMGDLPIGFDLPTDIFGTNHYFETRGVGISGQEGKANVFLFAGTTATASGAPFFQSARSDTATAMLFTDMPLSPNLHVYSKNVISKQRTTIQSIDWRARKWLRTGISAGYGSNQPYLAMTADVEQSWLSLKAAYIDASDRFHRVTAPSVYESEVAGANILAGIKLSQSVLVTVGHQNFLQPQSSAMDAALLHATVNQVQSTFDLGEFRFGAGLFQSSAQGRNNLAQDVSVSRKITNSIDFSTSYFRTISGNNQHSENLSTSIRETISPRLSLLQVINYSQGRATLLYGGSYLSNRFTIGVDYQTLYLPFLANPFSQGISINLRLRLVGSLQTNLQTFRTPEGRLRYTASGNSLMTSNFRPTGGEAERTFKHFNYVVRGHVRDEKGNPIEGAAIRVGAELVLTNTAGEFFVRSKKPGTLPLQVVFGEFLNTAAFRTISAPQTATASRDGASPEILVVLARE